ncbi:MAG: PIG-L family deacetylase [Candidatus Omnitrophica bacterium]|nr:PIG-L family deacetylase [Candidatus Omnitrophota bacterium]
MGTDLRYRGAPIVLLFSLLYFFLLSTSSHAQQFKTIEFSQKDRILILSPHPDDEVIGTGGVIQKAIKAGARIKVVVFTNGDHNELAFIVYEKRLVFRKKEFLYLGKLRRGETLRATEFLGLKKENVIFLGYPDRGTMEIFTKYWGEVSPYKSLLTRISRVTCSECLSPGASYVGENILNDFKKILLDFQPTKIFVSDPIDTNPDHRALYLFLQIALWELNGKIEKPEVFSYPVHIWGWPKPRGYKPELEILPPKKLKDIEMDWYRIELSEEEIKKKYEAILLYKSQVKPYPIYLPTFARRSELFVKYPSIKLKRAENLVWQGFKSSPGKDYFEGENPQKKIVPALAYGSDKENLFIRVNLKRKIDKDLGIFVFLIGYKIKENFSQMPKLKLIIDMGGVRVKDKKHMLYIRNVNLKYENKKRTIVLKVPYSVLGYPDYILTSANSPVHLLPFKETAWRIIEWE